jgi:hypothetical protein
MAEIYWVIGSGTDCGKTTLSTALIRHLNGAGRRTVGFKPYASFMLQNLLDLLDEVYPAVPSGLFGNDAWKLTQASPLTGPELVNVVAPVQILCYPNFSVPVLLHYGSELLGDLEILRTPQGKVVSQRPDLRPLIEASGLAFDKAQPSRRISLGRAILRAPEAQQHAFEHLLSLGAEVVVCEGAGEWQPFWPGCRKVDHLLVTTGADCIFFPSLNLEIEDEPVKRLRSSAELLKTLMSKERTSIVRPLPLARGERQHEVAAEVVRDLLEAAAQPS